MTPEDDRYRPGYELVAEQLLAYVAEHDLRPGDRLPTEKGLAEQLGATRNVTREAVKVLAAIGRLTVRKGAGIFVATSAATDDEQLVHYQPTDMEHVLMLLDYRRLIEGETSRRAAEFATPIQVRAIREHAERSAVAANAGDTHAFAEADAAFHDAVSAAARNVFLQSGVTSARRFAGQSDILLFHGDAPGSLEAAAAQHVAIAAAIAAGDPDLASALMTEHVDTTRHQFERRIRDRVFNRPPTLPPAPPAPPASSSPSGWSATVPATPRTPTPTRTPARARVPTQAPKSKPTQAADAIAERVSNEDAVAAHARDTRGLAEAGAHGLAEGDTHGPAERDVHGFVEAGTHRFAEADAAFHDEVGADTVVTDGPDGASARSPSPLTKRSGSHG